MATFENSIGLVLQHEGGFVNDAADPGGATNFGISLNYLKDHPNYGDFNHDGIVDINDIKTMTKADATTIYKLYWWNAYCLGNINNDSVALKIFDFTVNAGPGRGIKFAQQVCVNLGIKTVTVDGDFGPQSIGAVNALTATPDHVIAYLQAYRQLQTQFYQDIVAKSPDLSKFLAGWLSRVNSC